MNNVKIAWSDWSRYTNCVSKLQFCFAFDEQPQAHNFVTIYGTIFLFLELSVPLQEKKTAVINHSCQYKCRSFEPGMEKNQGVWYL